MSEQPLHRKPQADRLDEEPPFSPQHAFVVQFRSGPVEGPQGFAGRVEHVTSGQAARFGSLEGLVTFLTRVLTGADENPPEHSP